MKKRLAISLLIIVLLAGSFLVWRIGYSTRKSNDNLPALTEIAKMSESEVNDILPGYKISQLREVWGNPDISEPSTDSWDIGDFTLVVNYKNNGIVAICGLKDKDGTSVGE